MIRLFWILFVTAFSAHATPNACSQAAFERLLLGTELPKQLSQHQLELFRDYFGHYLQEKLLLVSNNELRTCSFKSNCLTLSTPNDTEKSLQIVWSETISHPEIYSTSEARILKIPAHYTLADLQAHGAPLLNKWTLGHSTHPYIPSKVKAFRLRPSQQEAIAAGIADFRSGAPSFLYVSPTGTGKSEVLIGILRDQLQLTPAGHFHIFTIDQRLSKAQFANDLRPLEEAGLLRLADLSELNFPRLTSLLDLAAQNSSIPLVVVSTIQGLRSAVETSSTAELAAVQNRLELLIFDEVHHLGAPTYLETVKKLTAGSHSKLLGTTATPVHRLTSIQDIFNNQSFWSYLDSPGQPHSEIYRSIQEVITQFSRAVQAGELTPVENFYLIEPEVITADNAVEPLFLDNVDIRTSVINPIHYRALAKWLAPLFDRHNQGFLTAANINEANALTEIFRQVVPNHHFEVLHSQVPSDKQAEIQARLRNQESLFVFTVKMFDEGVNSPSMSLYIDLNKQVGPRQLLQRLGRVARLAPNKEGIEIATLLDWFDEAQLGDNLVLLGQIGNNFGTRQTKQDQQDIDLVPMPQFHRAPLSTRGLVPISSEEVRETLVALQDQVRKRLWLQGEKVSGPGPQQRIEEYIQIHHKLPVAAVDSGARWWIDALLKKPQDQWPANLSSELRDLLAQKLEAQQSSEPSISPQQRLENYVQEHHELPPSRSDSGVYGWLSRLLKTPQGEWPSDLSPELRNLLAEKGRPRRRSSQQELQKITETYVQIHHKLPARAEYPYKWVFGLLQKPQDQWPADLSPELRNLLVQKLQTLSPQERIEEYVQEHHELPPQKYDLGIYQWIFRLVRTTPDQWPDDLSPELRELLLQKLNK